MLAFKLVEERGGEWVRAPGCGHSARGEGGEKGSCAWRGVAKAESRTSSGRPAKDKEIDRGLGLMLTRKRGLEKKTVMRE